MSNLENKKHLFWRAGFGITKTEYDNLLNHDIEACWDYLKIVPSHQLSGEPYNLLTENQNRKSLSREKVAALRKEGRQKVRQIAADWIRRMASPEGSSLLEKMCLFWHGHFACRIQIPDLAIAYLNTLRQHALGSFRSLAHAMSKDVAMIRFLNNQQNRKQAPNENFARELMELFTIGRGNYTEQDIKESARAFTGWSSNLRGEFFFRKPWHDYGSKEFMGNKGNFNGDDIIDIILEQPQTARFITRKIVTYFVATTIDEAEIDRLSSRFYQSDYQIMDLLEAIFLSDWFYDDQVKGQKIKSPVELVAGMARQLELQINNDVMLLQICTALGQTLFRPPNVAGWPGGRSWIDNASLLIRLNLPVAFVQNLGGQGRRRTIGSWDPQLFENWIQQYPDEELLSNYVLCGKPDSIRHLQNVNKRLQAVADQVPASFLSYMSSPEYQIC